MLPEDRYEYEDGGYEYEGEGDLTDGPRGKWFNINFRASVFVFFGVPSWKGREEDEANE
jgi:hypothetical protein